MPRPCLYVAFPYLHVSHLGVAQPRRRNALSFLYRACLRPHYFSDTMVSISETEPHAPGLFHAEAILRDSNANFSRSFPQQAISAPMHCFSGPMLDRRTPAPCPYRTLGSLSSASPCPAMPLQRRALLCQNNAGQVSAITDPFLAIADPIGAFTMPGKTWLHYSVAIAMRRSALPLPF